MLNAGSKQLVLRAEYCIVGIPHDTAIEFFILVHQTM